VDGEQINIATYRVGSWWLVITILVEEWGGGKKFSSLQIDKIW